MKMTVMKSALVLAFGLTAIGAQAAAVNNGDQLTINSATYAVDSYGNPTSVNGGSWFAMDNNGDSKVAVTERVGLQQGTNGIIIGATTLGGASHPGAPTSGDTGTVTAPWAFFGNTGTDFFTIAPSGSTTAGLNMSGWTVTWSGIPAINMGGGAWTILNPLVAGMPGSGYSNGVALFTWNGMNGGAYTLNYTATVPLGDPSGFGGVQYALHLEGVVNQVPVPAAVWLFGSGLIGLVGIARRKKKA